MKNLTAIFLAALFLAVCCSYATEENGDSAITPRYYYYGAWHNDPPKGMDLEKNYYWDKDRWVRFPEGHIHRPNNGYVFRDGRWEVDRNIRIGKGQSGRYYYDGTWHKRPKPKLYDFNTDWLLSSLNDYAVRSDYTCEMLEERHDLVEELSTRLEKLINRGDVEKILEIPREGKGKPDFVYDRKLRQMNLKTRADRLAVLMTLIENETALNYYTHAGDKSLKCRIFSLVDPVFYDERAGKPDLLMALNLAGVVRLLDAESDSYRRSGAKLLVHVDLGTITVVDTDERLKKIEEYLDGMPYSLLERGRKLVPGR